jgi:hypothetical protein
MATRVIECCAASTFSPAPCNASRTTLARHARKFNQSVRLVDVGHKEPAGRSFPEGSVRLPTGFFRFDAGRGRTGQVLCARLDPVATDWRRKVGSARKFRESTYVIKSWFVPPIVIPILIGLGFAAYITFQAFH